MAATLPYLVTAKNVGPLFVKIATAKVPDAFSQPFLYQTIGLKSNNDRALIPLLRNLGFIDASGKPTPEYSLLKNPGKSRRTMAAAIKRAYAPLFEANENADKLSGEDLKGLVAQVAGTDQEMTRRIVATFQALNSLADFSADDGREGEEDEPEREENESQGKDGKEERTNKKQDIAPPPLRTEFHYNIQVHLPSNATEETYLGIFNALRRAFS